MASVTAGSTGLKLLDQAKFRGCGRGAAGREGYDILSLHDDHHDRRRRKPDSPAADDSPPAPARRKRQAAGDVGNALRAAYDRMVDEDIPPEMLDLLGKLG